MVKDGDDEKWRRQLAAWYPSQPTTGSENAISTFALRGEGLFRELYEEKTRSIERVAMNPTEPREVAAEDWLCIRMPLKRIIRLLTFDHFAHIVNAEPSDTRDMIRGLGYHIPRARLLHDIMIHARGVPEYEALGGELPEPDEHTYERVAGLHKRISRSCDVSYEHLYGASRTRIL